MRSVIVGAIYKFKGDLYQTIAVGRHADSGQKLVVYRGADGRVWIRPKNAFLGLGADDHGRPVARFSLLVKKPK